MTMAWQRTGMVRVKFTHKILLHTKAQTTIAQWTHDAVTTYQLFAGILHRNKSSSLTTNSKLEWELQFCIKLFMRATSGFGDVLRQNGDKTIRQHFPIADWVASFLLTVTKFNIASFPRFEMKIRARSETVLEVQPADAEKTRTQQWK